MVDSNSQTDYKPGRSKTRQKELKEELYFILRNKSIKKRTVHDLSDRLTKIADEYELGRPVPPQEIELYLTQMKEEGINIPEPYMDKRKVNFRLQATPTSRNPHELERKDFPKSGFKFAAISNTELGNYYARDDALLAFYRYCEHAGVRTVLHCGDILAGPRTKHTMEEIETDDPWDQTDMLVKNYPQIDGIKTLFITAPDCEGKFIDKHKTMMGPLIQKTAKEAGRDDLIYVGHKSNDVIFDVDGTECIVTMAHTTGKVPYARSYPAQKMVQSLQGGKKPHLLILGHLMQLEDYLDREVWVVQAGGFKDQTPSMVADRQHADVGGYMIEMRKPRDYEEHFYDQDFAMIPSRVTFFNREWYEKHGVYRRSHRRPEVTKSRRKAK
ncbi:hypothetical protein GOV11_00545 [Candidatus Woesearchaeota archaeon]|nr:hypothetical protein [Candidatus Woesearchaeota archaeon]